MSCLSYKLPNVSHKIGISKFTLQRIQSILIRCGQFKFYIIKFQLMPSNNVMYFKNCMAQAFSCFTYCLTALSCLYLSIHPSIKMDPRQKINIPTIEISLQSTKIRHAMIPWSSQPSSGQAKSGHRSTGGKHVPTSFKPSPHCLLAALSSLLH